MRISDWSSDVCSSDLHVVVARKTVDHGKPKPCIGTFADKPRQRGPGGRGIVNSSTQLAQLLGKRGKQRNGVAVQAQARSEEHTSELQSLMRISYAVFCLKKKKQQIKTIAKKDY